MNYLHSFRTKNRLESRKNVCQIYDFCGVVIPSENTKIIEFNQCRKSGKTPSIICADLESSIKIKDGFRKNFEKSSTTKVSEHISCEYSLSAIFTFDGKENKNDVTRCEDCIKKFCKSLEKHAMKTINFEKEKAIPLTREQRESYENTKICHRKLEHKYTIDMNCCKVKGHCHCYGKYCD